MWLLAAYTGGLAARVVWPGLSGLRIGILLGAKPYSSHEPNEFSKWLELVITIIIIIITTK